VRRAWTANEWRMVNGRSGAAVAFLLTRLRLCVFSRGYLAVLLRMADTDIVGEVGRMLFFCTGAVTHNFQIAFERLQYSVKWHVLDHIRRPSTLQNFQYSIETIFAFQSSAHPCTLTSARPCPNTPE